MVVEIQMNQKLSEHAILNDFCIGKREWIVAANICQQFTNCDSVTNSKV